MSSYTTSKSQVMAGAVFNFLGSAIAPVAAIELGEVTTAAFSGAKKDVITVTNFQSNQIAEKRDTVLDPGQLKLSYNRVSNDVGQVALLAAFQAGGTYSFTVQLPPNKPGGQVTTGDLIAFNAIISEGPTSFSLDFTKQSVCEVTLDISGLPILTVGA